MTLRVRRPDESAAGNIAGFVKNPQRLTPMSELSIRPKGNWIWPTVLAGVIFGLAALIPANRIPMSDYILLLAIIAGVTMISGILNAVFDRKFGDEDPFMGTELSPESPAERTLCVMGGAVGFAIIPLLGMLILWPLFNL